MQQFSHTPRFFLVSLIPKGRRKEDMLPELEELQSLVKTYGGEVAGVAVQREDYYDRHTYIGKGKVYEVADMITAEHVDIVVINDSVKPGQLFTLHKILFPTAEKLKVWDRIDLILHIFANHAFTREAKLQIDLASMRHMGPRIFGMGMILSRQGGGIGTRGIGETNTELMKRHWKHAIQDVRKELDVVIKNRQKQLERRKRVGLLTVSIVGYTNAGKTTLFNTLTGKKKRAENVLFATLDSTSGTIFLPDLQKDILLTDTIGFIQHLPPDLIEAFQTTLLESVHADLLLHVIDASDPHAHTKIAVVEGILAALHVTNTPRIYVFNKIDVISPEKQDAFAKEYQMYTPQFLSSTHGTGVEALCKAISRQF